MADPLVSPIVELRNISKSFGAVRANRDISFSVRPGSIKALLGENGAGKSTLMSILSGMTRPDAGEIRIRGEQRQFYHPKDALEAGIGMVYQQFMLVSDMSVAENIFLGQRGGLRLSPAAMHAAVRELSQRFQLPIDPAARIGDLSMGERQRVEILKLLYRNASVLILDEPTAVLSPPEIEPLFTALRSMAAQGAAIVFISHKLQEVLEIADEVTVLRDGEVVDDFPRDAVPDQATLAQRMIGREMDLSAPVERLTPGETVLEVRGLSGNGLDDISFSLRRGEILAVAGVAGNGQKALVETLAGLLEPQHGELSLLGLPWKEYFSALNAGKLQPGQLLGYIPEDRRGLAVCSDLSLLDNFLLTSRGFFSRPLHLDRKAAATKLNSLLNEHDVRPPRIQALARALSGGNLQKFVIARESFHKPGLILAENPTQGLDISAANAVTDRLLAARAHAGVLLVTNELGEALRLGDRVAVMYQGRIMDIFPQGAENMLGRVGLLMAGIRPD